MATDFYPFVDADASGMDASDADGAGRDDTAADIVRYATRIAVYDDMLSTPRVIVVEPSDVRTYLEEVTNTVYHTMREQGGRISLMVVRELVENFIHADFTEPVVSILDDGNTIRFSDQGPGIDDKELAFEFGITSATREQKRYIRGTGAGLPMVEQYLENAGGAISIEDNIHQGTVVTVSIDAARVQEIERSVSRGAAVRGGTGMLQAAPQTSWDTVPSSYQQSRHEFSTIQQQPILPADPYSGQASDRVAQMPSQPSSNPSLNVSERGLLALDFMAENGSAGPTELAAAFGESTATWSRELVKLSTLGLVVKQGQKRVLTELGKAWLDRRPR